MKYVFIILTFISINAFATVDAMTSAWIVAQDIQDPGVFSVINVPVIGCYGLSQGPQLAQFTKEYRVSSSVGCGMPAGPTVNINALSCGKIVDSEESADFSSFKKIALDISQCPYKNNPQFIKLVRTAAKRNFPQTENGEIVKDKEVTLVLIP